jgi:hypothetical protein
MQIFPFLQFIPTNYASENGIYPRVSNSLSQSTAKITKGVKDNVFQRTNAMAVNLRSNI